MLDPILQSPGWLAAVSGDGELDGLGTSFAAHLELAGQDPSNVVGEEEVTFGGGELRGVAELPSG
jgi:hypothetical protein